MKKILSLVLAVCMLVSASVVSFAAEGSGYTFSVERVKASASINQYDAVAMSTDGRYLVFQTQRNLSGVCIEIPVAKMTMTWDSGAVQNLTATIKDDFADLFAVENLSKRALSAKDTVKLDVSYTGDAASFEGLKRYDNAIELRGSMNGQDTVIATCSVMVISGIQPDYHDTEKLDRWSGQTVRLEGYDYRLLGTVTGAKPETGRFTVHYLPYIQKKQTAGTAEPQELEGSYVSAITLNPDGQFTFADGSYRFTPPAKQKNVAFTLVIKPEELKNIQAHRTREGYYILSLVLEFADGCWEGGAASPLPLVFRAVYGTNNNSSGGGGGGGGGSSNSIVNEPTIQGRPAAASDVNGAITAALAKGNAGTIRLTNITSINPIVLKDAAAQAARAGKKVTLHIDQLGSNGGVASRLYLDLGRTAALGAPIQTGLEWSTERTRAVEQSFGKYFSNGLRVLRFEQTGAFGMSVGAAVKMDLTGLDAKNLKLYSYNPTTNRYSQVAATPYVDQSGFVRFNVQSGGYYIISSGALKTK